MKTLVRLLAAVLCIGAGAVTMSLLIDSGVWPTEKASEPELEHSARIGGDRPGADVATASPSSSSSSVEPPESSDSLSKPEEGEEFASVPSERGAVGELLWGVDSLLAEERAFLESYAAVVEGQAELELDLEGLFVRGHGNHVGTVEFLDAETGAKIDFAETDEVAARELAWLVAEEARRTDEDIAYAADRERIHATRQAAVRYADQFEELRKKRKIFRWKGGFVVIHPGDIPDTRREIRDRLYDVRKKYGIRTRTAWFSVPEGDNG